METSSNRPWPAAFRERAQRDEVVVVARVVTGQRRVQRMVEVVVPLSVEPVPAGLTRQDQVGVVEVGLGDQGERPALVRGQRRHLDAHLQRLGQRRVLERVGPVVEGEAVEAVDELAPGLVEAHQDDHEDRHEHVDDHQQPADDDGGREGGDRLAAACLAPLRRLALEATVGETLGIVAFVTVSLGGFGSVPGALAVPLTLGAAALFAVLLFPLSSKPGIFTCSAMRL